MLQLDAESCSATAHTWSGAAASGASFKVLVMQRKTAGPESGGYAMLPGRCSFDCVAHLQAGGTRLGCWLSNICMTCTAEYTYLDGIIQVHLLAVLQRQSHACDGKSRCWWQATVQADDPRDTREGCDQFSEARHVTGPPLSAEHALHVDCFVSVCILHSPLAHPFHL